MKRWFKRNTIWLLGFLSICILTYIWYHIGIWLLQIIRC